MNRIWEGFANYALVGIANTVIHWQLFFILRIGFGLSQAYSNLGAFCAAASFSFYVNALYTFAIPTSLRRYLKFMLCIGSLSFAVGKLGDQMQLPSVVTVTVFSVASLVTGFLISKWLVYRVRES
jgi:putative flippase GtrA